MIRLLPLLILLLLSPAHGRAQDAPSPADAQQQVILNQLDAFNRTDGIDAFSYASPNIQQMFRSWPTFMEMVERGYRPIYRNADAQFIASGREGGQPYQDVLITGQDGFTAVYRYFMQQQTDGSWRINGVVRLPGGQA